MPWFLTEYRSDHKPWDAPKDGSVTVGHYGADLWAPSLRAAKACAKRRGMNERVLGTRGFRAQPYFPAHRMVQRSWQTGTRGAFRDACHSLAFLGMVALASGRVAGVEILGDEGIMHNFIHRAGATVDQSKLIEQIRAIERRVPGYLRK